MKYTSRESYLCQNVGNLITYIYNYILLHFENNVFKLVNYELMHCTFWNYFHQNREKNMLFTIGMVPIIGLYYRKKKGTAVR